MKWRDSGSKGQQAPERREDPSEAPREERGGELDTERREDAPVIPKLSLPTGGGALRNVGEKFGATAFTGAGTTSVQFPVSPARALTPTVSLGYSTGAGNGAFGLGWRASVPSITRKTERGLPRYVDDPDVEGVDTFILSDAEDLVPLLVKDGSDWILEPNADKEGHSVVSYRPRVEGAFARIERWVNLSSGDTHWRTWSRDNVVSLFGQTTASRVSAPGDSKRVFSWLVDEVRDDRGNVVLFEYKQENTDGVDTDSLEEAERFADSSEQAQRYIKRIRYGNVSASEPYDFKFEVVFDYGEHETDPDLAYAETNAWPARLDTFSSFRPGFDLRTRRLCRRVLMFHHFSELGESPYLVRALELTHGGGGVAQRLESVRVRGYGPDGGGGISDATYPPLEFGYVEPAVADVVDFVEADSAAGLLGGIDGSSTKLVDLDGEGIPGVLSQKAGALLYKSALGSGRFGPPRALPTMPSTSNLATQALLDLDGDGRRSLVSVDGPAPGYFERTSGSLASDSDWSPFRALNAVPNVDLSDPTVQLIDLDGDGIADVLVAETSRFVWYPSRSTEGFGAPRTVERPSDRRSGPSLIYRDPQRAIFFADMTGDGLTDIVRISNGSVTYWPNLGHGRFGRAISMRNAPRMDAPDLFRTDRVRLGDTDGSGTSDIIYLGRSTTLFRNESGNAWSSAIELPQVPPVDSATYVELADILGKGTAALVWSTPLQRNLGRKVAYLDLASLGKPYLLNSQRNNMGLEVRVRYASSTSFYLKDKENGKPWRTRLPFPVQVVERVESLDRISGHLYVQEFAYRHGYFDGPEREFRGFGYVESRDVEVFGDYSDGLFEHDDLPTSTVDPTPVPPVLTKSWFHTGAYIGLDRLSDAYAEEYFRSESEMGGPSTLPKLPDSPSPIGAVEALTAIEEREALRSLKGMPLRTEVFALDGTAEEGRPYSVSERNYTIFSLQPRRSGQFASFLVRDRESFAYSTERTDDQARLTQTAALAYDEYGNLTRSASVAHGLPGGTAAQQHNVIVLSEATWSNQTDPEQVYRLGVPLQEDTYELFEGAATSGTPLAWSELLALTDPANLTVARTFDQDVTAANQKRLLTRTRHRYYNDALSAPLGVGSGVGLRALPYRTESLAFTQTYLELAGVLGSKTPAASVLGTEGGYVQEGDDWWLPSSRAEFDDTKFYLPVAAVDQFGNRTDVTYDAHCLLVEQSEDELGNTVAADNDYRVLAPTQITDTNGNRSQVVHDELGMVVKTAVMGKASETKGDDLDHPTTELTYDLLAYFEERGPVFAKTRAREIHYSDSASTSFQESYAYSCGTGAVIMTKVQAEPGLAPQRDVDGNLVLDGSMNPILVDTSPALRWIGNGRTILDRRGNPVRQYEPYFSSIPGFESEAELVEQGVTPELSYDALGRLVRTDFSNGTFAEVKFTPWESSSFDPNDTVINSDWYAERIGYAGSDPSLLAEKRAAQLAAAHHATPTRVILDALGRTVASYGHNGYDNGDPQTGTPILYETKSLLDVQGNVLEVEDARGNVAERRVFGQLGQALATESRDAGERWLLVAVDGQPLRLWDARGQIFRTTYDALRRPVDHLVDDGSERLQQRTVYGEALASPVASNHRMRVYAVYDGAGRVVSDEYDFKGNLLRSTRTLVVAKTGTPDWDVIEAETTPGAMAIAAASSLEGTDYELESTFDALNRAVTATSPENQSVRSVAEYTYQGRGLLDTVGVKHRGSSTATAVVASLTYDVKGRREQLDLGNGLVTTYTYDETTYRVTRIVTTRTSDSAVLQDLNYHYDPVGNVVEIRDLAQQTVYFSNSSVDPSMKYEYDALYRLTQAEGREHEDAGAGQLGPHDIPRISNAPDPNNPEALLRYTQTLEYDEVGNILEMVHSSTAGGWTRIYNYDVDGNRLWSTSAPGDSAGTTYTPPGTETYSDVYTYDTHGNMTQMPHTGAMTWNALDELESVAAGSTVSHYQYAGGNRVRKFVERTNGSVLTDERIYIGPFELYRRENGSGVTQETESLHVSDDTGRILLIETRVAGGTAGTWGAPWGASTRWGAARSSTPFSRWRYQLSNHLGSASAEVDENGAVISYEEYHPYGTTAYRATDSQTEVSAKRYRYTGKEKDEETGLYYHGARYYACWLGRWTAADPIGLGDGVNRFAYVSGNPVRLNDPGGTLGRAPEVEVNVAYSESSDGSASVTVGGSVSFGPFKIGGEFTLEKDAEPEIVDGPLPIEAVEPEPPEVQANREFLERQSQRNAQAAERAKTNTGDPSFAQEISNRVGEIGAGRPSGINLGPAGRAAAFFGSAVTDFDLTGLIENPQRSLVQQTPLLGNLVGFKENFEGGLTSLEQGENLQAVGQFSMAGVEGFSAVATGVVSGTLDVKKPTGFHRKQTTKGFQDHHIISDKNKLTKDHELLELADFDLQSRSNKIFLPKNPASHPTRSPHWGRHSAKVSENLARQMDAVVETGRAQGWTRSRYDEALRAIIQSERSLLRSGERALNRIRRLWAK